MHQNVLCAFIFNRADDEHSPIYTFDFVIQKPPTRNTRLCYHSDNAKKSTPKCAQEEHAFLNAAHYPINPPNREALISNLLAGGAFQSRTLIKIRLVRIEEVVASNARAITHAAEDAALVVQGDGGVELGDVARVHDEDAVVADDCLEGKWCQWERILLMWVVIKGGKKCLP